MLIPLRVDVPTDCRPWVNYALMACITLISIVGFYSPDLFAAWSGIRYSLFGTRAALSTDDLPLPVLAVTSTFLHVGYLHLLGNMLFLWIFGNAMNYKFRHAGYLGLYLAAALFGGMAHYGMADTPVVGASGAVNGVMGAFLVFFPRNDITVFYIIWIRPGIGRLSSVWIILLWIVWDVFLLTAGFGGAVALWAHVGGFAAGFGIAMLCAVMGWVRPMPGEQTLLNVLGVRTRGG